MNFGKDDDGGFFGSLETDLNLFLELQYDFRQSGDH
jgi:hypothetical protein